jgi:hypothetical protein
LSAGELRRRCLRFGRESKQAELETYSYMKTGEQNVGLALALPAAVMVGRLSREGYNLALEEGGGARLQVLPAEHEDGVRVRGGKSVQTSSKCWFCRRDVPALTGVESMGKGELSVRLALVLPVTATVCQLSGE